jgi:hypothetical protein
MLDGIPEGRPLPGDERVEGVEPGDVRRREHTRIEPAPSRHPAEPEEEDVQREQRQPERRHGDPAERDEPQRMVGRPIPPDGREDAEPDADDDRDDHRRDRELRGRRRELPEVVQNGVVRLLGLAEVAVHEVLQVAEVLHRQRPVEPVVVPERRDHLRLRLRDLSEVRADRIAGNELRQRERDERDPDRQGDECGEAPHDEADQRPVRQQAPHRPPCPPSEIRLSGGQSAM